MKPKLLLCLALVLSGGLFVAGCSSLTESQVHCTSLSHENQGLIRSDLNRLLVSHDFTATEHLSEYPSAIGCWFAPLRKGNADVTVSAYTNSHGMVIYVDNYGLGRGSANKTLTEAIVACVQRNAPDARVHVQVATTDFPLWPKE
jgi:hypothetical protein